MTADRLDLGYWDRAKRADEACRRWEHERDEARAERDAAQAALDPTVITARNRLDEIHRLRAELETAQAALARVEALHVRDSLFTNSCAECSDFGTDAAPIGALVEWPCATTRALRGEGQEAGGK